MTYRIAICDDEQSQIEYLTSIVSTWSNENGHICEIRTFPSAEAFLFAYEDDKAYDILLLDVEMRNITGVDLAKCIRKENETVQIVFVTGYADYISEGYEVDALHYLMKPVSPKKLCSVLDKATHNLEKTEKRIRITYDRQVDFVPLSQITYIEAQKQYVLIQTVAKTYRMKCSLADMETQLDEYFYKCQRSFIRHMLCLCQMRAKMVSNLFVLGYSRLGLSVLADENDTTYEDLLFENRSNVKDAMIGEAAKREGCTLVTDDTKFITKLHKVGIPTMTFEEFARNI